MFDQDHPHCGTCEYWVHERRQMGECQITQPLGNRLVKYQTSRGDWCNDYERRKVYTVPPLPTEHSSLELRRIMAQRIRVARAAIGMKGCEVAHALGTTAAAYSSIERGRYRPKPDDLAAIAKVLGVSVEWLSETKPLDVERIARAKV